MSGDGNSNKILITIDARETAMYNDIIDRDLDNYKERVQINSENLLLGDIHITYENITHIFERKTLQDLQASILDGRYKEQKARLLSTTPQKYITYIIEGDNILSPNSYSKNKSMIQSAYLHTLFRDNIRILYTKNIEETTTLILLKDSVSRKLRFLFRCYFCIAFTRNKNMKQDGGL
jgi:ERCC4-type nuclease